MEKIEKVKFTDPETQEVVEFIVEDETQLNGTKYLLVYEDADDGTLDAYILKEVVDQNDEVLYQVVEDEVEFFALAKVFNELTDEALANRLMKTGGTPYKCVDVRCNMHPGLIISASALNGLRRDVLNQLTAQRARRMEPRLSHAPRLPHYKGSTTPPVMTVQVTSKEQITGRLLKMNPAVLYVPIHILTEDPAFAAQLALQTTVCAVLPRIVHDGDLPRLKEAMMAIREMGIREVLAGNLGLLIPIRECGLRTRGDFGLNIYSSGSMQAARDFELRSACVSFEMTLAQIRDLSKAVPAEMLCYGRMPLMITENCLIRGRTGQCTCHMAPTRLTDKTGADFPVIRDGATCHSVLLNGKKLNMLDRRDDLDRLGLWGVRLYFTTENPREVDQVLATWNNPTPFDPGSSTRGLYLRGLE